MAASSGSGGGRIEIDESRADHIFRETGGHLTEDTPANRQLLEETANNSQNYLGRDNRGNDWYGRTLPDGSQAWTIVRNGKIINGGVNETPRHYNPETGLNALPRK